MREKLRNAIKNGVKFGWVFYSSTRRKKYHKKETSALTNIRLSKDESDKVREYWKPYSKVELCFHEFYTEKTGEFHVNYMPEDIYYTKVDPYFNDWFAAVYIDNKCYYESIFDNTIVKHPETILYRINGMWLNEERKLISKKDVEKIINKEKEIFVKVAVESHSGNGVRYFSNTSEVMLENFWEMVESNNDDIVVQRPLRQHEEMAKLNPSSVNTIRILSLLKDDKVKIYSIVARMGTNGSKVDNIGSGGICCGVKDDGTLKDVAYSKGGQRHESHPTTGLQFSTIKIPSIDRIKEIITELHPLIPHFRLVSWDIAIDENGTPILVEVNLKYAALDLHQLNNGPVFGDDTKEILDEVFRK